jgi:hypothetical protein
VRVIEGCNLTGIEICDKKEFETSQRQMTTLNMRIKKRFPSIIVKLRIKLDKNEGYPLLIYRKVSKEQYFGCGHQFFRLVK